MSTRRDLLALSAAALFVGSTSLRAEAPAGKHAVKPLPFDPKKLRGLSEKLLASHHENNYAGAVKNLNNTELEIAKLDAKAPGFVVAGLKERELLFTGSLVLHELYFGNLGGDGKIAGSIAKALNAKFEEQFRATALSLGGGSGWVMLALNLHTGDLVVNWSGNHTQSPAFGAPILVLDMYEHAYAIDYGAAAARYVDAFMQNVRWDEVDRRYQRALAARAALTT